MEHTYYLLDERALARFSGPQQEKFDDVVFLLMIFLQAFVDLPIFKGRRISEISEVKIVHEIAASMI